MKWTKRWGQVTQNWRLVGESNSTICYADIPYKMFSTIDCHIRRWVYNELQNNIQPLWKRAYTDKKINKDDLTAIYNNIMKIDIDWYVNKKIPEIGEPIQLAVTLESIQTYDNWVSSSVNFSDNTVIVKTSPEQ